MHSIVDILLHLPPLIGVSLDAGKRMPELYTIRDIMYHLQMTYYWLKAANAEMKSLTQSVEITSQEEGEHKLIIPTLIGTSEQLEYMRKHLRDLSADTYEYFDNTPLPQGVKHKVEQAYNNMMTALFNTELSTTYYEQLTTRREF